MKKLLIVMCAVIMAFGAYAQKGKSEVGVNLDLAPTFSTDPASVNLGIGAKYRYGISNKFRLDANFTYYFPSLTELDADNYDKISMYDISVNLHYLLKFKEKFTFYPLVGLGYIKVNPDGQDPIFDKLEDDYIVPNNIVLNIGVGIEYQITDHINAGLEIKYPIQVDVNPLPVTLGVSYKF